MAFEAAAKLVTVIGGSGFVGRYVVQELAKSGWRVRVVCRRPSRALFLRPLGGLGQIQIVPGHIRKPRSIEEALRGSDAVINLVGVLDGDFDQAHIDGAETVARAARTAGAQALVHVSAIGADPASPSRYGRSKAEGEARVQAAFPEATIIRPSIIFGPEDNFINRFARMVRLMPVVPLVRADTRFQPVYVVDVAHAIAKAATAPKTYAGKIFEMTGPRAYTLRELVEWIGSALGLRRFLVDVPDSVAEPLVKMIGWIPGAPITSGQYAMLRSDNIATPEAQGLGAFGIVATPLEAVGPEWLVHMKKQGRFTGLRTRKV